MGWQPKLVKNKQIIVCEKIPFRTIRPLNEIHHWNISDMLKDKRELLLNSHIIIKDEKTQFNSISDDESDDDDDDNESNDGESDGGNDGNSNDSDGESDGGTDSESDGGNDGESDGSNDGNDGNNSESDGTHNDGGD